MKLDALTVARFWSKVAVTTNDNECWQWLSYCAGDGYGDFRGIGSHRVAYAIFSGLEMSDLKDVVVRHSCDNPGCCNPLHLSTGTHRDNVRDRVLRNRSAIGEGNGRHKLTEDEVRSILNDRRAISLIANDYGVTKWCIDAIKRGRSWKHIPRS